MLLWVQGEGVQEEVGAGGEEEAVFGGEGGGGLAGRVCVNRFKGHDGFVFL